MYIFMYFLFIEFLVMLLQYYIYITECYFLIWFIRGGQGNDSSAGYPDDDCKDIAPYICVCINWHDMYIISGWV